eukprot:g16269.t1
MLFCKGRCVCTQAATWSWGGDGTCHARNLFVTWELSCELPTKIRSLVHTRRVRLGLLLLLRCCFKQRQAREVSPEELQAFRLSLPFETEMSLAPVAHSDPEKDPLAGGPPSHWGGGIALPAPANPRKEVTPEPKPKQRRSERVTFRTQDRSDRSDGSDLEVFSS